MNKTISCFPCILLLIVNAFVIISPVTAIANNNHWTPDDIVKQESASGFTFSPDGSMVAWIKSRNSSEKDRNVTDLYLTRLDYPGENDDDVNFLTIRLTRSEESDRSPFFSRDGKLLYFLSTRDDGKKLWALNLLGGEPYEVHEFEDGIRDTRIRDDGTIVFLSEEGQLLIESQREEQKDNTQIIEDTVTFKPSRLFSYDPESEKIQRLTDNTSPINTYAISDDSRYAVTGHILSTHYGADAQPPPTYYFWHLESGKRVRILEGFQTPHNFSFTENNDGFYFTAISSSDPQWSGAGISELYYAHNLLQPLKVPLEWDRAIGSGYEVVGNDVLVSLANGPTRKLAHYERTEIRNRRGDDTSQSQFEWRKRELDTGKHDERVAIAAVADDHKKVVFVYSTASTMPQYRIGDLDVRRRDARLSEGKKLLRLNSGLADKYIAKSDIFRWTGAEDNEVNGILYYPENYDPERRYPLVVAIRGGPAAVTLDWWNMSWAYFPHILSQKESFVLMPNYHGSSNHGLEFVESIKHRYYELELVDIINGINTLDEAGKIDTDSLGVMGWSNGSILSIALSIEYPDMFRVIGAGAGNVNWVSDYGTCMFGVRFDQSYIGGAPWDSTGGTFYNKAYIEKSPIFRMDQVKAPTIIFFGSEDRAVPRDQGWEHYRALQQIGKAPVRFLWFPDQPHGLQKLTHQTRKLKEEIAWFDRYLFGTYVESNRAFKEDSPLAELMKRDSLALDNGYFGVRNSDKLIPEVVPVGSDSELPENIAVGRFHVTNKQFQAFDPNHEFHPLHGNHPVRNISPDRARSYAAWLSDYTGKTCRLPNAEEAKVLHKLAHSVGAQQNTINRLSGYDITLDEVVLLRQKTDQMHPDQIIREAGSFAPVKVGDAEVYDLGGNVAEWFEARESDGNSSSDSVVFKAYGYGAIHFVDSRNDRLPYIHPEFTGFRIIREN